LARRWQRLKRLQRDGLRPSYRRRQAGTTRSQRRIQKTG
jgi:hypothetical protein